MKNDALLLPAGGLLNATAAPSQAAAPASAQVGRIPGVVLFVHQSADLYGSDRVLLDTATALLLAGGQPIVLLPEDGPLGDVLRARGVETHTAPARLLLKLQRRAITPWALLALAWQLPASLDWVDDRLQGRQVDLVHSNTLAVLLGAAWAWRRQRPHLWHVHEIVHRPRLAAPVYGWLLRLTATRVLCNSLATRRWLLAAAPALAARTVVAWNGVADRRSPPTPTDDTDSADWQQRLRPAGSTVAIGLVGRLNRWKGQMLLVRAAELLCEWGFDKFSLVFAGSAPPGQPQWREALERCVANSPMAARTVMLGFVADTRPLYAALDIVCVPSLEPEPFGLVAIEAMSAGLPVVAAAAGGLPEIVVDGRTGLLHPPGDAHALAQALAALLQDSDRRRAMGDAGRRRWVREFDSTRMAARVLREQQHCIDGSPEPVHPVPAPWA